MLKKFNKKTWILAVTSLLFLFTLPAALAQAPAPSSPEVCPPINAQIVAALFDRWNASLATNNPDKVVANYASDAVLLPTLSNTPRTNRKQMRAYFVDFLKKHPIGHIDQRTVRFGCDWATDTGLYTFTLTSHGKKTDVEARYSYVYEYIAGQWLIVQHHSSLMPEGKVEDTAL